MLETGSTLCVTPQVAPARVLLTGRGPVDKSAPPLESSSLGDPPCEQWLSRACRLREGAGCTQGASRAVGTRAGCTQGASRALRKRAGCTQSASLVVSLELGALSTCHLQGEGQVHPTLFKCSEKVRVHHEQWGGMLHPWSLEMGALRVHFGSLYSRCIRCCVPETCFPRLLYRPEDFTPVSRVTQ